MKRFILFPLFLFIVMGSFTPFNKYQKKHFIQNEATLVISGPGFEKEAKYIFPADIMTVGGYNKRNKYTEISFSRSFMNDTYENITVGINADLLSPGTVPLDEGRSKPEGHISFAYRKLTGDGQATIDITALSRSGSITIDVYTDQYVKGSFNGAFETGDGKKYTAHGDFKIMKMY